MFKIRKSCKKIIFGPVKHEKFSRCLMWTLMQHRVDAGTTPTDTQSRPIADTPPNRPVQTPPGRAGTPVRRSRTPDKWPGTPVRHARGKDESRDSTRSHSPIRRSSSSESCNRDASPVDFSAALNTEKFKDGSVSEDEDDEGSQKKVSAEQYQLVRLWLPLRAHSRSTLPSLAGHPGRRRWT